MKKLNLFAGAMIVCAILCMLATIASAELAVQGSGVARLARVEAAAGVSSAGVYVNAVTVPTNVEDYVTVVHYGDRALREALITVTALPVIVDGTGAATTNGFGSVQILDVPAGRILVHGVTAQRTVTPGTGLDAADGADWSLGTAAAIASTGAVVQATTRVNLCPSTSIDPITNVVGAALSSAAQFDGTTTAIDGYYNLQVDAGDIAAVVTNAVSGFIRMLYSNVGDY